MIDKAIALLRRGYTIPSVALELGISWAEIKRLARSVT